MLRRLRALATLSLFIPAMASFIMTAKWTNFDIGVTIGLGRIGALHCRPSTS
jgi:hypothetical protein